MILLDFKCQLLRQHQGQICGWSPTVLTETILSRFSNSFCIGDRCLQSLLTNPICLWRFRTISFSSHRDKCLMRKKDNPEHKMPKNQNVWTKNKSVRLVVKTKLKHFSKQWGVKIIDKLALIFYGLDNVAWSLIRMSDMSFLSDDPIQPVLMSRQWRKATAVRQWSFEREEHWRRQVTWPSEPTHHLPIRANSTCLQIRVWSGAEKTRCCGGRRGGGGYTQ